MYFSPLGAIFSAPKYAAVMSRICKERGIQVNLKHNLVEIKPDTREAVFANLNTDPNELITVPVSNMHKTTNCENIDSIGHQSCKRLMDLSFQMHNLSEKTTSVLQREPFLTMFHTINSSPLLVTK